jgi:hypothetical protein
MVAHGVAAAVFVVVMVVTKTLELTSCAATLEDSSRAAAAARLTRELMLF